MSELALKLIAENKAKHARGEDARVLDLGNCGLTEVPEEVGELVWLEELILSNIWWEYKGLKKWKMKKSKNNGQPNFLTQLPTNISNLGNLKKVIISGDEKRKWGINDLTVFSGCSNLRILNCGSTKVNNLTPISHLLHLFELDCYNTDVYDISPILPLLKRGIRIKNQGNLNNGSIRYDNSPVRIPPLEISKQDNAAILRYFEDIEKAGTDQIYEAKMILIGEGGAGKTTFCRKFFDPNATLPQEKDRTKGIDIHPLYFDIPGKPHKQFRLNIWDFAGQGKYQSAHSFFYTHRSLYVLVDDTRTLNENDAYRTLYNNWLQTAELFGGQSPVLVLHNEKEGCARTGFRLSSFQERFSFVHGELFRINLGGTDTAKIEDLRHQIERQALNLPHIGDTVPKTWVKVRDAIEVERQAHPYISAERYRELCAAEGITDSNRQLDLSQYFHDLGVFLHFQDNPLLRRDVFLQNQWVTDAVYKILDDAQIAGQKRGRFYKKDLVRLWHESTYHDRRDELLALMLQFELCYQVVGTETYICPQLLSGDIPTYDLGVGIPLQLKYEYVFMPKGLLNRLMVRLHRHIAQGQTAVWNAGVVLERAGAKAEILESLDRRTISVRATGLRAKELITIINEEVERLHEPFGERLQVAIRIPCNCRICKENHKPHFYDKTDLDTRVVKGKATVECSVSYDDVPVKGLLEGVFHKPTSMTQKVFISYSHKDETFKEELDTHLSALKRGGLAEVWHDRRIDAGTEWDDEIRSELESADIILLLVSANFLASDYIWKVEIARAMERHQAKEATIIPIFIRSCDMKGMPFEGIQGLPRDAKPVASFTDKDEAYLQIARGIRAILET